VECEPHRRLKLWLYDLRTNKHFTLKQNPLTATSTTSSPATIPTTATNEKKASDSKSFTSEGLIANFGRAFC
jgi:type I restriction enzyme M protein